VRAGDGTLFLLITGEGEDGTLRLLIAGEWSRTSPVRVFSSGSQTEVVEEVDRGEI
jgi:hypothetical protein